MIVINYESITNLNTIFYNPVFSCDLDVARPGLHKQPLPKYFYVSRQSVTPALSVHEGHTEVPVFSLIFSSSQISLSDIRNS